MRLDLYLVKNQMVKSRSQATDLIKRGLVLVNDQKVIKAGYNIKSESVKILELQRFVGRGGEKLLQAILDFKIEFHDKIAIDIGSSTGGFTDCMLQHGARLVYAYDVGNKQMDETLKLNQKIVLNENTNILDVKLPDADIITIDVSFTSIKPIFNHLKNYQGEIIALIKPQFEAGHIKFKSGVLKDKKIHKQILIDVLSYVSTLGFKICNLKLSGLKGKSGNQEYVLYIKDACKKIDIQKRIEEVLC